jgi:tRNA-dihydrouridine synthase
MYTLITAAATSQAHQLKNKLNTDYIILGDYSDLPSFMVRSANMLHLPDPKSMAYAHEMLTLCLEKQISAVYALREEEQTLLNEAAQLFEEYGITIVERNIGNKLT